MNGAGLTTKQLLGEVIIRAFPHVNDNSINQHAHIPSVNQNAIALPPSCDVSTNTLDAFFTADGFLLARHLMHLSRLDTIDEFERRFPQTSSIDLLPDRSDYRREHYETDGIVYLAKPLAHCENNDITPYTISFLRNYGEQTYRCVSEHLPFARCLAATECALQGGYYLSSARDIPRSDAEFTVLRYRYRNELDHLLTYLISKYLRDGGNSKPSINSLESGLQTCIAEI